MLAAQSVFQYREDADRSLLSVSTEQRRALAQKGEHRDLGAVLGVATAKRMQVPQGKAAPWSAQYGKPRDAIHGMQERTGERGEVLHLLAFAQLLNLYCAEGNHCLAKSARNQVQVGARADQDGDAELASFPL